LAISRVSRRQILVGLTGATAVAGGAGLWLVAQRVRGWRFRNAVERGAAFAPSAFLAVEPSGDVVIWLVRAEMGQGVDTALPMLVAEELDADWQRVRVERAVLDQRYDYGSMATVASASIQSLWIELRRAGAAAREMLVSAAADAWNAPASELATERSAVLHTPTGRRITYGELATAAASQWRPLRPRLKAPHEFRLIGQPLPRLDAQAKIAGTAVFGLDVRVPNMVHAAIARSPTFGGRPVEIDDSAARAAGGVLDVLEVPSGIAVVGEHSFAALRGRDALRLRWPAAAAPVSSAEISAALAAALAAETVHVTRDDAGNAAAQQPALTADYEVPYLAHAPLEPMNCTASVTAERCDVWAPTQTPDDALQAAARITGLPPARIAVHTTYLGGGFGRRAATDFVAEAVDLSRRLGRPVQVVWSREDDMRNGLYRPAVAQRIAAALGADGRPVAWRHRVASVGTDGSAGIDYVALMGADPLPYDVGAMRVEWAGVRAPVPTAIWRSVGHSFTAFAVESFLDELATAQAQDAIAYRLSLLNGNARLRRCLEEVAEASGWAQARSQGRALGAACTHAFGSHIALIAELASHEPSALLRVTKIWAVVDCGIVVNPDGAAAQLEGGILFGLTAALLGRITVADGSIVEGNFDTYPLLRIDETPELHIRFIASAEPPGGLGELGVPAVAPAVANALFAARGTRLRTLPLRLNG
jgi:isoquinoline 1-oxidoreductase beta subunit